MTLKEKLKGKFIVIEGIDGTGKTTQSKLLKNYLDTQGIKCVANRQPSDTPPGLKIRELATKNQLPEPKKLLNLFIQDREIQESTLIKPNLEMGNCILLDRYYYSNIAYQSSQGVDEQLIKEKNKKFLKPDLVIFLNLPQEIAEKRINNRNEGENALENVELQKKVYKKYQQLSKEYDFLEINGNDTIDNIHKEIIKQLENTI